MEISDLPSTRRSNVLKLFSEHVAQRMASAPSRQITGLDREFSVMIQVHNTYFSGMKSGARTIGDKLARQIETLCKKSSGWLDDSHEEEKPGGLAKFLQLAEKVYLSAPDARRDLARAMRDAMKQQSEKSQKIV